jgi:hypothetical protein
MGLFAMAKPKTDPTKDPEFQSVVKHFLSTPPKKHEPLGKKPKPSRKKSEEGQPGPNGTNDPKI